jgi:ATP-binding cassette, subfamily F, member 3
VSIPFRLPKTKSQWGEALIVAYDVGYGVDEAAMATQQGSTFATDTSTIDIQFVKFAIEKRPGFLFDCVDMCIDEGSRYCILGPRSLTSALMRILARRLIPVEGTVHHVQGLRVGYCDSQAMGEVTSRVGPNTTALNYLAQEFPEKSEQELRGHMTAFGLSPVCQTKTPICFLSGGETFRFVLAKTMVEDPSVLCLEHPSSNLDVESVEALAHGLREWNGTLIMVCHDASFLRSFENIKCVVVVPEEGKVRRIVDDGGMFGMDAYLKTMESTKWKF